VSVTTLEEVFIRLTRGDETDAEARAAISVRRQSLEERRLSMELERRRSSLGGGPDVSQSQAPQQKEDPFASQGAAAPAGAATSPGAEEEKESPMVDYSDDWSFFRRHMYALLVKRVLYFRRDKKAWAYQFVMPALFVLAGCFLMRSGLNSIFAEKMPPLTLGLGGYNPGIRVDPNPFPFNAEGGAFLYQDWSQGGSWEENPSVTGQAALLNGGVPGAADMPVYPVQGAVSVLNMSQVLLDSRAQWRASRYGAVSFAALPPVGADAIAEPPEFVYNVHANYSGAHAGAIFQNLVNEAILKRYAPGASITASVTPLRVTALEVDTASSFDGFPVVVMIMLAFAFVPAAFALFVVRERETKAKHLQVVSGVSFLSYWLSTWLFDFASYQIPLWLTVIILKAFDAKALVAGESFGATVVLLELYGASVTGFTYLTSFAFARHSMAQVGTILVNFLFGLILMIVTTIMSFIPTTREAAKVLVWVFRLVPAFSTSNALINVVFKDFQSLIDRKDYSAFDLPIAGYGILYMACEAVVFFAFTLLLEYLIRRPAVAKLLGGAPLSAAPEKGEKDEDVAREEARVASGEAAADAVVLKEMTKVYKGGKFAVRGISLGIPNGECFGLLGINGAGKVRACVRACAVVRGGGRACVRACVGWVGMGGLKTLAIECAPPTTLTPQLTTTNANTPPSQPQRRRRRSAS
jgi:ATP-binding cassette, subfamily A (ABC1), member 3